ncbi:hypothetical protein BT69DRAFT_938609 [Atractiella rhizophila]|nr:hypothetical protein BT69DRAFT_938609 [Atractiella rhizophila]
MVQGSRYLSRDTANVYEREAILRSLRRRHENASGSTSSEDGVVEVILNEDGLRVWDDEEETPKKVLTREFVVASPLPKGEEARRSLRFKEHDFIWVNVFWRMQRDAIVVNARHKHAKRLAKNRVEVYRARGTTKESKRVYEGNIPNFSPALIMVLHEAKVRKEARRLRKEERRRARSPATEESEHRSVEQSEQTSIVPSERASVVSCHQTSIEQPEHTSIEKSERTSFEQSERTSVEQSEQTPIEHTDDVGEQVDEGVISGGWLELAVDMLKGLFWCR